MYYVYVLENQSDRSLYIGFTADVEKRFRDHVEGKGGRTTRLKKNWKQIYYECYLSKEDALGREKFLKSGSGRKFVKKQLTHYFANYSTPIT